MVKGPRRKKRKVRRNLPDRQTSSSALERPRTPVACDASLRNGRRRAFCKVHTVEAGGSGIKPSAAPFKGNGSPAELRLGKLLGGEKGPTAPTFLRQGRQVRHYYHFRLVLTSYSRRNKRWTDWGWRTNKTGTPPQNQRSRWGAWGIRRHPGRVEGSTAVGSGGNIRQGRQYKLPPPHFDFVNYR